MDDDFAQEVSEFQTMAELRESLEKQYQEKASNETKQNIQAAIVEELLKHTTIDLPETLIEEEVQNILMQTANQIQSYGMDINQFFTREMVGRMRETAKPEANKNLHSTMIIEKVSEQENISVSEEEINNKFNEIKESLKDKDVDEERLLKYVKSDLIAEKNP